MSERSLRVLPLARSGEGWSGLAFPHPRRLTI
ncbi:hypothetical protein J2Z48_002903 [Croceifilum oryzae]|uniref:Uncharacterized protein n=1 Tax=Croceifilum oryzae TaxID=1553429 RepID=A0AAJ1TGY3_9BACL|nr:hypothetical protein [Croceifilum oryzae]